MLSNDRKMSVRMKIQVSYQKFYQFFWEKNKIWQIFLLAIFNISLLANNESSRLWLLFVEQFGLVQFVQIPLCKCGGLLDHVICC